jgi:hypothetical protein
MERFFHKLTTHIDRVSSETFASTMQVDPICKTTTQPMRAAFDYQTERQLIRTISIRSEHLYKDYVDDWDQDPAFGSLGSWVALSSNSL